MFESLQKQAAIIVQNMFVKNAPTGAGQSDTKSGAKWYSKYN